jgi:dTDP-4-amino-4,6-dideoxygalactose transaminase
MNTYKIPFNKAYISGLEIEYMTKAISRNHISGEGSFSKQCHKLLEELLGVPKVLLTTSCTHALEMAAILTNIQHGDEVIIPAFTFVSTVNAFVLRGARPVFIDIRADTLNMDEDLLEDLVNPRTKAVVPVHYAGVGCEMDTILEIANDYHLTVIEDNAHGLFGSYKNKYLGTFGSLATQSFHETKNITCGEGGALIIINPDLIERAEIIREKGTDRSRYFRGQVDKYTWVDYGSSYLPSDILAAFLLAQLESRQEIQDKREKIWKYYQQHLTAWAELNTIRLPAVPDHCDQPYHMFYMLFPDFSSRQKMISHLANNGILSVFHYIPLHTSEMGKRFGGKVGDCPVSEQISERLLRLPFYTGLHQDEQNLVIEAILSARL